jgi:DNA-binding PadR family transcriptional regulator
MNKETFLGGNFLHGDMRRTMLKVRILRRIKKSSLNAYGILKEMSVNKRTFKFFKNKEEMKNDIYNTIKSLEKSGFIKSSQKTENGRIKQYYKVTAKGDEAMRSAKKVFMENLKKLSSIFKG